MQSGSSRIGHGSYSTQKNVSIQRNDLKEQLNNGTIELKTCQTENVIADVFNGQLFSVSSCRPHGRMGLTSFCLHRLCAQFNSGIQLIESGFIYWCFIVKNFHNAVS